MEPLENKTPFQTNPVISNIKKRSYPGNPESGPRILFFSGGSALQPLSRHLIRFTHNSIHIITPFDSGGSSANFRNAFNMPAVGDIRNRLIALTDLRFRGNTEICDFFSHRMPENSSNKVLLTALDNMARGQHPLLTGLSSHMSKFVQYHIQGFMDRMPPSFELGGASIGNLILASGYLSNQRQFDPIISLFSKLASVRGIVAPVINKDLHLVAGLENGETIVGQHLITGKKNRPINSPIKQIFLCEKEKTTEPIEIIIDKNVSDLLKTADLVVYPMGSFYSSIISNLMPQGTGYEISRLACKKIYIPNTAKDPECLGCSVADQVQVLLSFLKKDSPENISTEQVLSFVLVDREKGMYANGIDEDRIRRMGVGVIDYPLVTRASAPLIDERQLTALLLNFASKQVQKTDLALSRPGFTHAPALSAPAPWNT